MANIFVKAKNWTTCKMTKIKNWAKQHPVASKVVVGLAIGVPTAAGAVLAGRALVHKEDDPEQTAELQFNAPEQIAEDFIERRNDLEDVKDEEDQSVWEANKEDWQKVIDVSKELNNLGGDYDGYHIYKLGDEVLVAKTTDEGCSYHYHDEEPAVKEEPTVEATPEEA